MVGGIAEKHHATFILVGKFKTHDIGPKFRAALDVAHAQHHVANLFDFDGRAFCCHKKLLSVSFAVVFLPHWLASF
jgi:hypothetical protein